MMSCRPTQQGQKWRYLPSKQLQHEASGYCLDAGWEAGADVKARPCKPNAPTQIWHIDYTEDNGFQLNAAGPPSELELKLQKLRGQRRIGRSLMAATEAPNQRRSKHKKKHRRSKKHSRSGRSKNRFILKLVRTRANGSLEHLEADIHCRHEKLLPNNTFVRDLVALLTDHDIKVINNGRVFERNKVTELAHNDASRSTLPPLTQSTLPPTPISVQPKLWPKREKKRIPPPPALRTSPPRAPLRAPEHKIIIEDFVEVGGGETALMEPKYKQKQRMRVPRPPRPPLPPRDQAPVPVHAARNRVQVPPEDEPEESPLNVEESRLNVQTSVEDTPMVSSDPIIGSDPNIGREPVIGSDLVGKEPVMGSEPVVGIRSSMETKRVGDQLDSEMQNSDNEEWFMDGPHFRTNGSKVHPAEIDNNEIDEPPRLSTTPAHQQPREIRQRSAARSNKAKQSPLKVVMKSNLTFNLGDELFKWRAQDDVADLLGELTQPVSSPPVPIQTQVPDRGDQGDSDSNSSGSSSSQE